MAPRIAPTEKPRRSRRHKSAKPRLESLGDAPPQQAEVIKPKRKPRWDEEGRSAE